MQRQHTGRPGTVVVPAGWATAPAVVVGRTLASTIRIGTVTDKPQWNEGRGQSESGGLEAVYAGPASIMAANDGSNPTVVDDEVSVRTYDITLAMTRPGADLVTSEHLVLVEACDDPALVGRRLQIQQAELGTRRFSRVLRATLLV